MPTISKPFCSTIEVHIFTRRGTLSILELDVRGTLFGKTSCSRLADIGHSSRGTPKFDEEKCAYYKQFILILLFICKTAIIFILSVLPIDPPSGYDGVFIFEEPGCIFFHCFAIWTVHFFFGSLSFSFVTGAWSKRSKKFYMTIAWLFE